MPLTLQFKPSRYFLILLTGGHVLAGTAVLLAPLPWLVQLGAVACLGLLLLRSWHQAARNITKLVLRDDGKLDACLADGSEIRAHVLPSSVVWPWLAIIRTRELPPLIIFQDGLQGVDAHRQLRIWLGWLAVPGLA